jgi:hypothetical protein
MFRRGAIGKNAVIADTRDKTMIILAALSIFEVCIFMFSSNL